MADKKLHKFNTLKSAGKVVFSPNVYKAVERYIQDRYETDVLMDRIVEGRWKTIKTHMVCFKRSVNAELKLDTRTEKALVGYQSFRRDDNVTDSTIRNEQATNNHFVSGQKWKDHITQKNISFHSSPSTVMA